MPSVRELQARGITFEPSTGCISCDTVLGELRRQCSCGCFSHGHLDLDQHLPPQPTSRRSIPLGLFCERCCAHNAFPCGHCANQTTCRCYHQCVGCGARTVRSAVLEAWAISSSTRIVRMVANFRPACGCCEERTEANERVLSQSPTSERE